MWFPQILRLLADLHSFFHHYKSSYVCFVYNIQVFLASFNVINKENCA